MQYTRIKGVIVPLLTPFNAHGALDPSAIKPLVDFLVSRGVQGLFPGGTTGEGPLLTPDERHRLTELVVAAADGRVAVIAHTGAITTEQTVALTRQAQSAGAQAAAVIPPYFYHHSDDALYRHYATVAATVPDFPLYLYNNPSVAGNTLSTQLVERLVKAYPNIVGLKDSSGSLDTLLAGTTWQNGSFNTANGQDALILPSIAAGIDACVSGNANFVPELVVALVQATVNGDLDTARRLQQKLNNIRAILSDGADLSLLKGMLAQRGLAIGTVRAPLLQASEATIAACWQALSALDLALLPVE